MSLGSVINPKLVPGIIATKRNANSIATFIKLGAQDQLCSTGVGNYYTQIPSSARTTTSPADERAPAAVVPINSGNHSELPRYTLEGLTLGRGL